MSSLQKGLLLAALQVAIVASLGAKLTWDRHRLPRAWAKAGSYDPNLPIRGRYLALQLEVLCDDTPGPLPVAPGATLPKVVFGGYMRRKLRADKGHLTADCAASTGGDGVNVFQRQVLGQPVTTLLSEPILFFLPENAPDPWQQAREGELWAEVTVPVNGLPRPIRLAIKKDNVLKALEIN